MRAVPAGIGALIDAYRAHLEIDLKRHAKHRQIELAASLKGRRVIYLDLKFACRLNWPRLADPLSDPYTHLFG